jgi:zinc resistance-associated protein
MRRSVITATLLAGIAGLGIAGVGIVGPAASRDGGEPFGERGPMGRWSNLSPEDRAAFADARIAALHAGLKLNADQEKLWPPVESAIRDLSRLRREQRTAMRERGRMIDDAPGALRAMADAATARGEALRKLADASQPLYATLDADQKRRALMLSRPMRPHFGHGHRHHGGDGR